MLVLHVEAVHTMTHPNVFDAECVRVAAHGVWCISAKYTSGGSEEQNLGACGTQRRLFDGNLAFISGNCEAT